ncbi:hypothetical protein [Phenylobacterium sp.]|uniref:hypothetical protein n=1 Tax=Phenylobacterium sp. TaxID=1871053 RepID=UPI002FC8B59E
MKNIMIVDGAENATLSIFQVTDEEFAFIFPADGQDIEFIEDVVARAGDAEVGRRLRPVWDRPILKRDAMGLHGTLYYEYSRRKRHFPVSKREVDWDESAINFAQRELFAGKR